MRKTVHVQYLKDRLNTFLAASTCSKEERQAVITFVTNIFHDTGNYQGFTYNEPIPEEWRVQATLLNDNFINLEDWPGFDHTRRNYLTKR